MSAERWIESLGLIAHPEGGFYRETYRSSSSTAIYFLLRKNDISAFHRIASDELWHFYAASPSASLRVWRLIDGGEVRSFVLGSDPQRGQVFQDWVPAGLWFGAEVESQVEGEAFVLVGCTVAPGFRFEEFELAAADSLLLGWPDHETLIRRLCLHTVPEAGHQDRKRT